MAWRSARVVILVCIGAALVLLLADLRGVAPTQGLRGLVGAVAGPVEEGIATVRDGVAQRVGGSAGEQQRIEELEADLAESRAAAAALAGGQVDLRTARELAAGLPASGFRQVPARLVAHASPQDQVRSATISAGSSDGVGVGMAVVGVGGLAGVVESVSPGVATIRLLTDPATALPARVAATAERGVLRGDDDAMSLTLLDPLGAMGTGDLVVTLGSVDGAIPADLPLGRITTVLGSAADLTRHATVGPAVDASTLDRVLVLVPEAAG